MTTNLLRNLIAHVITELADMDASFGKTKLVKLLYLIDVENYRIRRRTISGLKWVFYHYGPYAFEIDTALEELSLDVPQESVTTQAGYSAIVFRPNRDLHPQLGMHISSVHELRLIERVIREWGMIELNPLLNHVYFYTEPMRYANRGEVLDFSTIQRRSFSRSTVPSNPLPPNRLKEYKEIFQQARAKRVRRPLDPAPRFDKVYEEGLAHMTEEERYEVLPGALEISEEVKERLREQRDDKTSG